MMGTEYNEAFNLYEVIYCEKDVDNVMNAYLAKIYSTPLWKLTWNLLKLTLKKMINRGVKRLMIINISN